MKPRYIIIFIAVVIASCVSVHIIDLNNLKTSDQTIVNTKKQIIYNINGKNENWEIVDGIYLKDINSESFELGEVKYLKDMKNIKEVKIEFVLINGTKEKKYLLNSKTEYIQPSNNNVLIYGNSSSYSPHMSNVLPDFNYSFECTIKYTTRENKSFEEKIPIIGTYKQLN
ncbi:hypothetical protein G9F71_024755 [Clostridium sp. FP2]|uniref:hypothetical protein n=1 Tax=Clostridium TaxID=1485 RepID=UPI0013E93BEC|nr:MULTISPECIES: hypothetical protein [Clostridium]MBW9158980.1 hypothetical protein [Clostridium tagluense]MBZ9626019.1 hypothetical protein [Clostridium sp. FP2]WLC68374.1 hypothetical protein KTC93_24860 [Clostridium tagluense]